MKKQLDLYRSDDYLLGAELIISGASTLAESELIMPRLLGKPARTPLFIGVALLAAITGAVALEYYGAIDIIPGFGQDRQTTKRLISNNSDNLNNY
jgi:hypothetical protein